MSNAEVGKKDVPYNDIGIAHIKVRRRSTPITCGPVTNVGDCVPFYLCPRSIMLYLLHMGNHPDLPYRGGQAPIIHLESDLERVAKWASGCGRAWAVSTTNASAAYVEFYNNIADLDKINWEALQSSDFASSIVKVGKQAEFLIEQDFPWSLVERIGVCNDEICKTVQKTIANAGHQPPVTAIPAWYY